MITKIAVAKKLWTSPNTISPAGETGGLYSAGEGEPDLVDFYHSSLGTCSKPHDFHFFVVFGGFSRLTKAKRVLSGAGVGWA
jgi:hypothetical protein